MPDGGSVDLRRSDRGFDHNFATLLVAAEERVAELTISAAARCVQLHQDLSHTMAASGYYCDAILCAAR